MRLKSCANLDTTVLLFEPRRMAQTDQLIDIKAPEIMEAIPHLLAVIRDLGNRSELVKQLVSGEGEWMPRRLQSPKNKHIEAVHRLLRCDCMHLVNQFDFTVFHRFVECNL
jgi:hypothetical protein